MYRSYKDNLSDSGTTERKRADDLYKLVSKDNSDAEHLPHKPNLSLSVEHPTHPASQNFSHATYSFVAREQLDLSPPITRSEMKFESKPEIQLNKSGDISQTLCDLLLIQGAPDNDINVFQGDPLDFKFF